MFQLLFSLLNALAQFDSISCWVQWLFYSFPCYCCCWLHTNGELTNFHPILKASVQCYDNYRSDLLHLLHHTMYIKKIAKSLLYISYEYCLVNWPIRIINVIKLNNLFLHSKSHIACEDALINSILIILYVTTWLQLVTNHIIETIRLLEVIICLAQLLTIMGAFGAIFFAYNIFTKKKMQKSHARSLLHKSKYKFIIKLLEIIQKSKTCSLAYCLASGNVKYLRV